MIQILKAKYAKLRGKSEDGVTLVEYALLLALIAIVCIVVITTLGHSASNILSTAASSL
jgi:pilus assembly protein Flp/PilA